MSAFDPTLPTDLTIAGVDEAGRGPLAGPVVAAAVILNPNNPIEGLKDSKKLSHAQRMKRMGAITSQALDWSVGIASVEEIDTINILQASLLAMSRAIEGLSTPFDEAWIDGNHTPKTSYTCRAIIKGDTLVAAISAASIVAKVTRDRMMQALDMEHPEYGFAQHNGYGTQAHLHAIHEHGPLDGIHRKSFAPIKSWFEEVH